MPASATLWNRYQNKVKPGHKRLWIKAFANKLDGLSSVLKTLTVEDQNELLHIVL